MSFEAGGAERIIPMTQDPQTLRRHLLQLKELHESGAFDGAQYEQSKATLERRLLDLVISGAAVAPASPVAAATAPAAGPSRALLAVLAAAVVLLAAGGYWWSGSPGQAGMASVSATAGDAERDPAGGQAHAMTSEQIGSLTDKLAQRLRNSPNDADGWAMLARSYSVLGRHAEALSAYESAIALRSGDAALQADYAEARVLSMLPPPAALPLVRPPDIGSASGSPGIK